MTPSEQGAVGAQENGEGQERVVSLGSGDTLSEGTAPWCFDCGTAHKNPCRNEPRGGEVDSTQQSIHAGPSNASPDEAPGADSSESVPVGAQVERELVGKRCSFCGKSRDMVKKFIVGPGVFICNECVREANRFLKGSENYVSTPEEALEQGLRELVEEALWELPPTEDGFDGLDRLDWLRALLDVVEGSSSKVWKKLAGEDPDAFLQCVSEARALHDRLRRVLAALAPQQSAKAPEGLRELLWQFAIDYQAMKFAKGGMEGDRRAAEVLEFIQPNPSSKDGDLGRLVRECFTPEAWDRLAELLVDANEDVAQSPYLTSRLQRVSEILRESPEQSGLEAHIAMLNDMDVVPEPSEQETRVPDAMTHATHWRRHLDEWDRELTVRAYDPEKMNDDGPPWPVWIGTPPTLPTGEHERWWSEMREAHEWIAQKIWQGAVGEFHGDWQEEMVNRGLLIEVPATEEFREMWDHDRMFVLAWNAHKHLPMAEIEQSVQGEEAK